MGHNHQMKENNKKQKSILTMLGTAIGVLSAILFILYMALGIIEKTSLPITPSVIIVALFVVVGIAMMIALCIYAYVRFDNIEQDIGNIHQDIGNIHQDISGIKISISEVLGWIKAKDKSPLTVDSPLALNDMGKQMANDISADSIIEAHEDTLIKKVNPQEINNAYDVQKACLNISDEAWGEILSPETLKKIKDLAFNNGIKLEHYYEVLGIKLRDALLSLRDEKLSDVDKHNPADSSNSTD